MRIAVISVPSMIAIGVPVSGSKQQMTAWCVGRSRFCGNTLTNFVVSAALDGRYAGIAAKIALRSATTAPTRGGTDARPALKSTIAASTASISRLMSSTDATSDCDRTSTSGD